MNTNGSLKLNNSVGGGTYKHSATIMLTGTIDCLSFNRDDSKPKINVILDNTLERLSQYENTISRYVTESYFTDIVFVENSGYPFPYEKYVKLAKEYGKRFEFLYRKLSDDEVALMQEKGKSWGECDLIDYAMTNSVLISQSEAVYKVTGRVFLKNSKQILKRAHKESEFIRMKGFDWCVTVFFKILKEDYFNFLKNIKYEVNDREHLNGRWENTQCIELRYYLKICNSNMKVSVFNVYPSLDGITASRNESYNSKWWKRAIYNILPNFMKKPWKIK